MIDNWKTLYEMVWNRLVSRMYPVIDTIVILISLVFILLILSHSSEMSQMMTKKAGWLIDFN